ncbi:MAG: PAS domain S-box protein [Cyanobacteria bacterium REEB67]|nr:PAS domain S-box protein [Cyanobacteria bacterium REEB67]
MKLRSSLSLKVLVLVALPLIVQWGCLLWLYNLQISAERAVEQSLHARDIAEAITHLRIDMYRVLNLAGGEKITAPVDEAIVRSHVTALQVDYTNLLALTIHDDAPLRKAVEESQSEMMAGFNALIEIKKTQDLYPNERWRCKPLWVKAHKHLTYVLKHDFADLRDRENGLARRTPGIRAALRRKQLNVMAGLAVVTLALSALAAIFLTRGITMRVAKVADNAYRLAAGRPLTPLLAGADEIASLDRTFHEMARSMRDASRKERAVVQNARDFICSLNSALKLSAVNPACERTLEHDEKDLLGQSLLAFVPAEETGKVRDFFEALKKQALDEGTDTESSFETILLKADKSRVNAEFSAHWSKEEESFFVVAHDITDRRQAEALKQEVVVMVTHDLRTPLATLQNILKFLRSGNFGQLDPKGSEYISVANRNVERMANLVNDLLDIEKVKSGLMTLDKQEVALEDCFKAAVELAGAFAEEAGVQLEVKGQNADLVAIADQDRLTRVLGNLIANAVKFSPQGGRITIEAKQEGDWIYTSVSDQGSGIPPDQLAHIFERFRQVEDSTHKGKGGSGLGLTICQAIVQLHGGKIWAENLPQGGSRFIFTVPAI